MESTLGATGALGSLGTLATPARKTRRKAEGVSSRARASKTQSSSRAVAGEQSTSYEYVRGASVEALSDVALVEQVLTGTQDAFAVLVERYKDAVQNLAYRMLSNTTEAE